MKSFGHLLFTLSKIETVNSVRRFVNMNDVCVLFAKENFGIIIQLIERLLLRQFYFCLDKCQTFNQIEIEILSEKCQLSDQIGSHLVQKFKYHCDRKTYSPVQCENTKKLFLLQKYFVKSMYETVGLSRIFFLTRFCKFQCYIIS